MKRVRREVVLRQPPRFRWVGRGGSQRWSVFLRINGRCESHLFGSCDVVKVKQGGVQVQDFGYPQLGEGFWEEVHMVRNLEFIG
jgi:hypothetical protein